MAILIDGLSGLVALAGGLLVRGFAGLALLGLLMILVLPLVFVWYWLVIVYDGVVGIRSIGQLRWRPDSYYTPGHLWLRPMGAQAVRVGLDDIAQRVLPGVESVSLAAAGSQVNVGESIADIRCGHGRTVLRSPIKGTIVASNPRVSSRPGLLNREPLRRAWLVEIVSREAALDRWVNGSRARTWLADEGHRLSGLLERSLGMAVADGGELIRTTPDALSDEQWREVRAAFLETGAYGEPGTGQPLAV